MTFISFGNIENHYMTATMVTSRKLSRALPSKEGGELAGKLATGDDKAIEASDKPGA